MSDVEWQPPADARVVIVCAANKLGGTIITGARHYDTIMRSTIKRIYGEDSKMFSTHSEQGFIDQWGRFYNRQYAMKIVQANGQPFDAERNKGNGKDLYSEGLY